MSDPSLAPRPSRPRHRPAITRGYSGALPGADICGDETEFLRAMTRYQQRERRPFPTFTEVLAVLKSLGWRKTETLPNA